MYRQPLIHFSNLENLTMMISDWIESETMSSIRSTLIRSCFANIQRELLQLEDWLNRDLTDVPDVTAKSGTDSNIIYQSIQQLSRQLDSQQHTLHRIIDRIDVLEETRNIHIGEENNLWLDSEGVQLQNEVVDYESIVNVNKTDAPAAEVLPEAVTAVAPVAAPIAAPAEDDVKQESVEQAMVQPVVESVQEKEEKEEEEEEEEDGLEEVEYNGTTYYRDSNLVMYLLDDDGELTDAVGVWKEKTQTIKFYKK